MHCSEVKQRLNATPANAEPVHDEALREHLAGCAECRDYAEQRKAEELRLTRQLAAIPVPPPSEGFADRALARAWETAHGQPAQQQPATRRYAWAGLAASVLVAVVLVTQWLGPRDTAVSPTGETVVQVAPETTRPVHVRLVSKEALPNATITVRLDGDVALTGYPGMQTLSWQAPIVAGTNQMSLPVALTGSSHGSIVIEVSSGGASKQMRLSIEPRLAASASGYPTVI